MYNLRAKGKLHDMCKTTVNSYGWKGLKIVSSKKIFYQIRINVPLNDYLSEILLVIGNITDKTFSKNFKIQKM